VRLIAAVASLVEVWDQNFRLPVPAQPGLDEESGRGLMLVGVLAERWGWDLPASGIGKIVWALKQAERTLRTGGGDQRPLLRRAAPGLA
jgi:hypothetical protein